MIRKGDSVVIKKGARVRSTHPKHDGVVPARRAYSVTVCRVSEEVTASTYEQPAMVHWAGSGGYWRWCPVEDVIGGEE